MCQMCHQKKKNYKETFYVLRTSPFNNGGPVVIMQMMLVHQERPRGIRQVTYSHWKMRGLRGEPCVPPPFHHCCPRSLQQGNDSNAGEQMCQRRDLCVFYWLCPSVNTVACFFLDFFEHVRMPEETYWRERMTDG